MIKNLCDDPNFVPPDFDVDAFNAQAVERFYSWGDPDMLKSFEQYSAN